MLVALRTCDANMQSRGGFQWPGVGETVTAPDWTDNQECGGGLHGLLWGQGDWSLLARDETARWVVFKPLGEMSHLGGKIKCESAEVLFIGGRLDAWQFLRQHVTNLQGANLQGANLWGANLQGANIRGANLWGANLQGANIRGVKTNEYTVLPGGVTVPEVES